jgi:hypothetical protein
VYVAEVTTIEGVLDRAVQGLEQDQPVRRIQDPEGALQVDNFIAKFKKLKLVEKPFTLVRLLKYYLCWFGVLKKLCGRLIVPYSVNDNFLKNILEICIAYVFLSLGSRSIFNGFLTYFYKRYFVIKILTPTTCIP